VAPQRYASTVVPGTSIAKKLKALRKNFADLGSRVLLRPPRLRHPCQSAGVHATL
jgi:hypothetical protein